MKHLQRLFSDLVLSGDEPPVDLFRAGQFSAARRLEVYQNAVLQRLEEAVSLDFPLLREKLGDDEFFDWVDDFLLKQPSTFPNISEVSSPFPDYVAQSQGVGFFSELARFEWCKAISELAPEPPRETENIRQLSTEILPEACFVLEPSLRIFRSEWNVPHADEKKPTHLLIRKENGVVTVRPLEPARYAILEALGAHMGMDHLLERISGLSPEDVTKEFAQLVQHGMIVGFLRRKRENNRQASSPLQ